jgi:RNA 3'-terminal phosphate cyclase
MIALDGSQGEGGGQILRTAVSLSHLFGTSLTIFKIRAGRPKPGLAAQHLAGINLVGAISNGSALIGNEIQSTELKFTPGSIDTARGKYHADPKTAGSITLMLQIALPCLLLRQAGQDDTETITGSIMPTTLELGGGTNVMASPPIEHFQHVLIPLLNSMMVSTGTSDSGDKEEEDGEEDVSSKITCKTVRSGYFPRGGGLVRVSMPPSTASENLTPLQLERGGGSIDDTKEGGDVRGRLSLVEIIVNSQVPQHEWEGVLLEYESLLGHMHSLVVNASSSSSSSYDKAFTLVKNIPAPSSSSSSPVFDSQRSNNSNNNNNNQHQHKNKKQKRDKRGQFLGLTMIVRYEHGATLYTNIEDLSTLRCEGDRVTELTTELCGMMAAGACLDERTADQVILYQAMAMLRQRQRQGIKEHTDTSSTSTASVSHLLVAPPSARASSDHLQTVSDIVTTFFNDTHSPVPMQWPLFISIEDQPGRGGCRLVTLELKGDTGSVTVDPNSAWAKFMSKKNFFCPFCKVDNEPEAVKCSCDNYFVCPHCDKRNDNCVESVCEYCSKKFKGAARPRGVM